jgi:hypothetical protein
VKTKKKKLEMISEPKNSAKLGLLLPTNIQFVHDKIANKFNDPL